MMFELWMDLCAIFGAGVKCALTVIALLLGVAVVIGPPIALGLWLLH